MSYALGPVKPHVRAVADALGAKYGITTIHGWGMRGNATEHDDGLALDFMTTKGGPLAEQLRANAGSLGVTYVIWDQRIWSVARSGEGWRAMENRGSATANHKDHVHVSFTPTAPAGFSVSQSERGSGSTKATPKPVPAQGSVSTATPVLFGPTGAGLAPVMLTGAGLTLGVVLILVGVARITKPATDQAADTALTVATLIPQTRAVGVAAGAAKGAAK